MDRGPNNSFIYTFYGLFLRVKVKLKQAQLFKQCKRGTFNKTNVRFPTKVAGNRYSYIY